MTEPTPCYVLALDQGTQSTRASLITQHGEIIAQTSHNVSITHPSPGHVEQDGEEIIHSLHQCIDEVFEQAEINANQVISAGLATQRSSVVAWDRQTGHALSPILSWQDTRAADWVQQRTAWTDEIQAATGLPFSAHYGASKLRWLHQNLDNDNKNVSCVLGPVASFYLANLLDDPSPMVDCVNALRTQLVNQQTLRWDAKLLQMFSLTAAHLPKIRPTRGLFGKLSKWNIPVTATNGDQSAALFAQGAPKTETVWVNLGTGGFVLYPTEHSINVPGLINSLADNTSSKRLHLLEGTVNGAGSALNWAMDKLKLANEQRDAVFNKQRADSQALIFINGVSGLGSPWWRTNIDPHWIDLNGKQVSHPDSDAALLAVYESILFLVHANLQQMLEHGCKIEQIEISGGLSQSRNLCQRLADLTQRPVTQRMNAEATTRGIAWLAAGGPQTWKTETEVRFEPAKDAELMRRYQLFLDIIQCL